MTDASNPFLFHVGQLTDKGRIRNHNEDSIASFPNWAFGRLPTGWAGMMPVISPAH